MSEEAQPADEQEKLEKPAGLSAEKESPVGQGAADILPEPLPPVKLDVPAVESPGNGTGQAAAEPIPVKLAPARPAISFDAGDFSKKTPCPECGKAGWKSEQALKAHIRFAHELPAKKAAALEAEKNPPPPDFTDIDGAQPAPPVVPEKNPLMVRYETMANMTFDMSTGMLARIFGPEWNPSSTDERAAVVLAIQKYYESVQLPDIPPGYMLCFVCAAYAAPRLGAQPTKTKLQRAWLWLKSKFSRQRVPPMVRNGHEA